MPRLRGMHLDGQIFITSRHNWSLDNDRKSPMRLLLVEDDTMLAQATADAARQNAWQLDHAPDAASARIALLGHSYDAVVLDLGLPGACGLTVLHAMRSRFDSTPVLILTARGQLSERIAGLDAGADDYLTKPFQFDKLWARIRAVTRRSRNEVVPILSSKDIRVDVSKRIVTRAGEPVHTQCTRIPHLGRFAAKTWTGAHTRLSARARIRRRKRYRKQHDCGVHPSTTPQAG